MDKTHIGKLKEGVEVWNRWRHENPNTAIDLSNAKLPQRNLSGVNLADANLAGADLQGSTLDGALLSGAELSHARLVGVQFSRADLHGANLDSAELQAANLSKADLSNANLNGARLTAAELIEANLNRADCRGCLFRQANLVKASLDWARLSASDFHSAVMTAASLRGAIMSSTILDAADLRMADLRAARLKGARLNHAKLRLADLQGADLEAADLQNADLEGADLRRTNLTRANLERASVFEALVGSTVFGNIDLSNVNGIDTLEHVGPSVVGIDTVYRTIESGGSLPFVFLEGVGVPGIFIEFIDSLQGIDYYSCYICYAPEDRDFARLLFERLRKAGVRVWDAQDGLRIGEDIQSAIHKSILRHDKLLVILSSSSLRSQKVGEEVRLALEREEASGKSVLFPVKVDNAILDHNIGWPKSLRNRHVGDFTEYANPAKLEKAFRQLLHDLRHL